jgi:hypothetical protein
VALLHLKRTAAICEVEDHLIDRVKGGFGPEATLVPPPNATICAVRWSAALSPNYRMLRSVRIGTMCQMLTFKNWVNRKEYEQTVTIRAGQM